MVRFHFPVKPNKRLGVSACIDSSLGRPTCGLLVFGGLLDEGASFGGSRGDVTEVEVLMRNNNDAAVSSSGVYTGEDDGMSLELRRGMKPVKQG